MSEYTIINGQLYHHGIKGQKWGVRRYQNKDGTLTALGKRRARKDAEEYARAKMYYGEGAGTRRKLIKATVEERSKNENYKKAFDEALANQDMSKHAAKAKRERRRNDAAATASKTGRGVVNVLTGHPERLGAGMMTAYMAYNVAHKTGADKVIAKMANDAVSKVKTELGRRAVERTFRKMGM